MRLLVIGCEYAGKHTLGVEIDRWWSNLTGQEFRPPPSFSFHDHFVLPHIVHAEGHEHHKELSEKQMLTLNPHLLEHFQRYQIFNKLTKGYKIDPDLFLMDFHYGDAVYAPLYYGYGKPGMYADRRNLARSIDAEINEFYSDMVLVLVKASPDAIRHRMANKDETPFPRRHELTYFKGEDAETVLARFDEEFEKSLITRKIEIDTTDSTVEESLADFVRQIKPFITNDDYQRILGNRALETG
ncbi:MAG: hypothetical protein F4X72_09680 [Dehalococcoidia bacterium]|nr:hypothetical protein [Dehalococcoidia bacterium]